MQALAQPFHKLDLFDQGFLLMVGRVRLVSPAQHLGMTLKKLKDIRLWGPESALLRSTLIRSWRTHGTELVKEIQESFIPTKDWYDVNGEHLTDAYKNNAGIGLKVWSDSKDTVKDLFQMCQSRAADHFNAQRRAAKVAKFDFTESQWASYLSSAMEDHLEWFITAYPERILQPAVQKMIQIVQTNPEFRTIDRGVLKDRIANLMSQPEQYLANTGDLHMGRLWAFTGLQTARAENISTYIIVSKWDAVTCDVCAQISGKTFDVNRTMETVQHYLDSDPRHDGDNMPFPDRADVDNRPPESFLNSGLIPPIHPRCRCDIVYGWSATTVDTGIAAPGPALSVPNMASRFINSEHAAQYQKYEDEYLKWFKANPSQSAFEKILTERTGGSPELSKVYMDNVRKWMGDPQHTGPQALKYKATQMERDIGGLWIHPDADVKATMERIVARAAEITDEQYLRLRAFNQAYLIDMEYTEIGLWRGVGWKPGEALKNELVGNWGKVHADGGFFFSDSALSGYTADARTGSYFGHERGGVTVFTRVVREDVFVADDVLTAFYGVSEEKEWILMGGKRWIRYDDIQLPQGAFVGREAGLAAEAAMDVGNLRWRAGKEQLETQINILIDRQLKLGDDLAGEFLKGYLNDMQSYLEKGRLGGNEVAMLYDKDGKLLAAARWKEGKNTLRVTGWVTDPELENQARIALRERMLGESAREALFKGKDLLIMQDVYGDYFNYKEMHRLGFKVSRSYPYKFEMAKDSLEGLLKELKVEPLLMPRTPFLTTTDVFVDPTLGRMTPESIKLHEAYREAEAELKELSRKQGFTSTPRWKDTRYDLSVSTGKITQDARDAASEFIIAGHNKVLVAQAKWIDELPTLERIEKRVDILRAMMDMSDPNAQSMLRHQIYSGTEHIPTQTLLDLQRNGLNVRVSPALNRANFTGHLTDGWVNLEAQQSAEIIAHEFSHAIDSLMTGGGHGFPDFFGTWQDSDLFKLGSKESVEYRKWYADLHHPFNKGTFTNGDGEYWLGNFISTYEGRIYPRLAEQADQGIEWFSMNSQRYANYFSEVQKFDKELDMWLRLYGDGSGMSTSMGKAWPEINRWAAGKMTLEEARLSYAARMSDWKKVKEMYPELAKMLEEKVYAPLPGVSQKLKTTLRNFQLTEGTVPDEALRQAALAALKPSIEHVAALQADDLLTQLQKLHLQPEKVTGVPGVGGVGQAAPEMTKAELMKAVMDSTSYADIERQMKRDLDEISTFRAGRPTPLGVTGTLNKDTIAIIKKNMVEELKQYGNYLAGDTALLARDLIDDYTQILKDSLNSGVFGATGSRQFDELGRDFISKLVYQEIESNRQQFTDHGIRHLVGNWKMASKLLESMEKSELILNYDLAPMKLKSMFTMVNHDIGYTTPIVRAGGMEGINASGFHKLASEKIMAEQIDIWDRGKIFTEREFSHIRQLILTHDGSDFGIVAKQLNDPLAAVTQLSDNLSIFQQQKLPSMFKYVDDAEQSLLRMQYAAASKDTAEFELERGILFKKIDGAALSEQLKRDLKAAVKELNYMTPKFALPTLAGDAVRVFPSKQAVMVLEVQHNQLDVVLQNVFDMGQRQLKKALEDLGVTNMTGNVFRIGTVELHGAERALLEIRILGSPPAVSVEKFIEFAIPEIKMTGGYSAELYREGKPVGLLMEHPILAVADYAERNSIPYEMAVERIEGKLQTLVNDSDIYVRRSTKHLKEMRENGGMINQYDTGKSTGLYNPSYRRDIEQVLFGAPASMHPSDRAIYGYLASDPDGIGSVSHGASGTRQYGNVAFKLKPEVRARTTFIFGDSLDDNRPTLASGKYAAVASPMNQPSFMSAQFGEVQTVDQLMELKSISDFKRFGYGEFVETQIWGGVRLQDIEEIIFSDEALAKSTKSAWAKYGIKVRYSEKLSQANLGLAS